MIPSTGNINGNTCPQCGMWVQCGGNHSCTPGQIPVWPSARPAGIPAPQWDFSYKPTQREYFVAKAMQGMVAIGDFWPKVSDAPEIARLAIVIADAVIAGLTAKPGAEQT